MEAKTGEKKDLVRKGHLYEPKLDGLRTCAIFKKGKLTLANRRGRDITFQYPEFDFSKSLDVESCVLDAEIVVYNRNGIPDFQLALKREQNTRPDAISDLSRQLPATLVVSDILMLNGRNLTNLPLIERKDLLDEIIIDSSTLQRMYYSEDGVRLWDFVMRQKLAGVVAKRMDSTYEAGRKTDKWLKIKNTSAQDCVIAGFTQKRRVISAFVLAAYYNGKLRFVGNVNAGLPEKMLHDLYATLSDTTIDKPPFPYPLISRHIHWVKPHLVCEVQHLCFGTEGLLRSPVLKGLRFNKSKQQCMIELPGELLRKQIPYKDKPKTAAYGEKRA